MSATDRLLHLRVAGFRLDVEGGTLLVGPASKLTDETREVNRASQSELVLAVLDRADDPRVICIECSHYGAGRCADYRSAGLFTADVGPALGPLLQRCPAFETLRWCVPRAIAGPRSIAARQAASHWNPELRVSRPNRWPQNGRCGPPINLPQRPRRRL